MNRSVRGVAVLLCLSVASCLQPLESLSNNPIALIQGFLNASSSSDSSSTGLSCGSLCVGGQIFGDSPTGLALNFNGTACGGPLTLNPTATGFYSFEPVLDGCSAASVTITTQPTSKTCQIYNNTGISISGATVSNVDIYCFSVQFPAGPLTAYEETPLLANVTLSASPGPTSVLVNVGSSNAAITTTSGFTFTQANFSTAQSVTFTNVQDANTTSESSTMTAYISGSPMTTVTVNSVDTTLGSFNRYVYVTSGLHNGDFANDSGLTGANWMEKADSYCSLTSNMSAETSLIGTGNYRALMVDGTLRNGTPGGQTSWPIRSGVSYQLSSNVTLQVGDVNNIFAFNLLTTSSGNYWTGTSNPATWATGISDNCDA